MKSAGLVFLLFTLFLSGCRTPTEEILTRGAFTWGVALDGYPLTPERLAAVSQEISIPSDRIVFFMLWPEKGNVPGGFPLDTLNAIHAEGALPCLTWEPMFLKDNREVTISAQAILSGEYDVFITAFAKAAAQWKKPLLIRFAHEMNLSRYHWGGTDAAYGLNSPELYKQMFRYLVSQFDKQQADNVLWAFCPNAESVPHAPWNTISAYYPGDDVVDCLGVDGYNWGTTQTLEKNGWNSHAKSFDEIFRPAVTELRTLSKHKPLFVFETASVTQDGCQHYWLAHAIEATRTLGLDGITWFHVNKEIDWRLQAESAGTLKRIWQDKKVRFYEKNRPIK
jgi:hypothetical protein